MTTQSDFKARVRARMARTGERYAAARAVLVAQAGGATPAAEPAGAGPSAGFGGLHTESAAIANLLREAGVVAPHSGEAVTEAMAFGLCGGIGFMAFAFDYADHLPTLTLVLRSDSYPDAFVRQGLERLGADVAWHETGSARVAARTLDAVLADGGSALVVVDIARLPWYGLGEELLGFGPTYVRVAAGEGDAVAVDDRAPRPLLLSREALADARAGYRKGRHALASIRSSTIRDDLGGSILDALRATARGFHEAPYPGYASNFGMRGLEKWARQVEDARDARGWPRLFATPSALAAALVRTFEGIQVEFTPPSAGRRLYADFLDEAAAITGRAALAAVADHYRHAADAWDAVAEAALPADVPVLAELRRTVVERHARIDALGAAAAPATAELLAARRAAIAAAEIAPDRRAALLAGLGARARAAVEAERAALAALEGALP